MPLTQTDVNAIQVGISAIPLLVNLIKSIHATANPTNPPLTDADVLKILTDLGAASIAKDDAWIAAHHNG